MVEKIKVYSTQTCPWCHRLKDFLKQKKVDFEDIDLTIHPELVDLMIEKSGEMGVPQMEINGKWIIGFDQAAIEEELKHLNKK